MQLSVVRNVLSRGSFAEKENDVYQEFLNGRFDKLIEPSLPNNARLSCDRNSGLIKFWIGNYGAGSFRVRTMKNGDLRIDIQMMSEVKKRITYKDYSWNIKAANEDYSIFLIETNCLYDPDSTRHVNKRTSFDFDSEGSVSHRVVAELKCRDFGPENARTLYENAKVILDEYLASLEGDEKARFGLYPEFPASII